MDGVLKKDVPLDITDVSGGANSVEYPLTIGKTQVQPETVGMMLKKSGIVKYPGCEGLSASTTFTKYLRHLSIYRNFSGGEYLLGISNGVLSMINQSTGALSGNYNMGYHLGRGWKAEAYGKAFLCNGGSVVKIESAGGITPVGIVPPSGSSATAVAGATLPEGTYSVIVGYARREAGLNVLYSRGETVGNVVLAGANRAIQITMANSSDSQVGNKVVWIKSPDEEVHYFFYETTDNTTTTFTISDTSQKNLNIVYEGEGGAIVNYQPPQDASFIFAFADRLWLVRQNKIYYSQRGGFSEYDLEIFDPSSVITTGYNITGLFSVGTNLYANTTDGILIIPKADPNAVIYIIEPRWHFVEMNTVDRWNNGIIGLTNDGVRYFDGESFSNFDMAYNIKSKIASTYSASRNFPVCGFVYKRSFRNEYHLLWQDTSISTEVPTTHAVLNLDSMFYNSPEEMNMAWEFQPFSANFAVVSKGSNVIYYGQSHNSAPKIYKESGTTDQSRWVYKPDGTLLADWTNQKVLLRTRTFMPLINGTCWIKKARLLAVYAVEYKIRVVIADKRGRIVTDATVPLGNEDDAKYDEAKFDVDVFPYTDIDVVVVKFPDAVRGRTFYVEIEQTANDPGFQVMSAQLTLDIETGNFL